MFKLDITNTIQSIGDHKEINQFTWEFPEQPAWDILVEKFHNVLKSMGYVFDYDDVLDIVKSNSQEELTEPSDSEDSNIETRTRKGKRKT